MPRPRKIRWIQGPPVVDAFLPKKMPPWGEHETTLPLEGLEALRLSDYQGLDHETASAMMNVSRQTFGRILAEARATVAEALVMGKILKIEGGHFDIPPRGRRRRRWRGGK
jgi:predicted DNA-binding protein (UPF0251 family)